jgi:vacuole morphology and inheritance protein 14
VDVDVKNGANLLDRLIKDIVTETDSFDIEAFIPLLQKHIKRTKPYIRQLLVGWITVLDAVPDINMLDYLPDFLDGLFNMLSDGNREIKQSADNALTEFLKEIKEAQVIEFGPMIRILVGQCRNKERATRLTAMIWMTEFIKLGGTRLLNFYAEILGSVMFCISDAELEIGQQAKLANNSLMQLVKTTTDAFDLNPLLHTLTMEILSEHVITRVAALQWINMLHEKDATEINKTIGDLLPALLKAISDSADEVVLINLQVLARISLDEVQFLRVLNALVQLFLEDRALLESRGALVVRKLCSLLDSRSIYMSIAAILNDKPDLEFVSLMVQTLNLILLTAPELSPLRRGLKDCFREDADPLDKQVFATLFRCWSHNPVATFSLCLLAQAYDLSACLILKFAEVDVTVGFLMQIDKLVQLLESPIFIRLRLHLLEVDTKNHADLLKSLYGLLMLLPQSQAYKTLSDRLATVSSLHMHVGFAQTNSVKPSVKVDSTSEKKKESGGQSSGGLDYNALLKRFEDVQELHTTFRQATLREKSLLSTNSLSSKSLASMRSPSPTLMPGKGSSGNFSDVGQVEDL